MTKIQKPSPEVVQKVFDKISKAKALLMGYSNLNFFISICFQMQHVVDNEYLQKQPTAATDGKKIYYHSDFVLSLTEEEIIFLIMHETLHRALDHLPTGTRIKNRDPKKWNVACDYMINDLLKVAGLTMPKCGLHDIKYREMSAEEIYDRLPINDYEKMLSESLGADLKPHPSKDSTQDQQELKLLINTSIMQNKMSGKEMGTIPGELQVYIDSLTNPVIPWQKTLSRYMTSMIKGGGSTYQKLNRRYMPHKLIVPSNYTKALNKVLIATDMSGSVSDKDINQHVSEIFTISNILKPKEIKLAQFDTRIISQHSVKNTRQIKEIKFKGRGGTAIEPVIEWANKQSGDLLIVFTDGHFYMSDEIINIPTIWLIHDNKNWKAPFGTVINYNMPHDNGYY